MRRAPKLRSAAAAVVVWALAAGCGDDATVSAPVVIPSTAATTATPSVAPSTPTSTPTPTPTATATRTPSVTPSSSTPPRITPDDLVTRISDAASGLDAVHLSIGSDDGPPVVEADYRYGDDTDYEAVVDLGGDSPVATFTRVSATLYLQVDDGDVTTVEEGDPRLEDDGPVLAYLEWDALGELGAVLQAATSVEDLGRADLGATTVSQYAVDVDATDLILPSPVLPDGATGAVTVVFSLADDDLPVRVDYELANGSVARVGYSDWGTPVTVVAPAAD